MPDSGMHDLSNTSAGRRSAARLRVEDAIRGGIIGRVRSGDAAAFESLYAMFSPMIHAIVISMVPLDDVDDLVQEVFLEAYRGLGGLRDDNYFGGWIAGIARNRARDFHRTARPVDGLPDDISEVLADERSPNDAAREALDALRSLPETYRETLAMRLVEGMTGPEIASLTGLTPESVRVNLHRGMKLLRERLGVSVKTT